MESAKLRLALEERYVTHCRVITDRLHYYRLIVARNGAARNFKDILVAAICEDDGINTSKIYESQLRALLSKISDAAGFFHLDLTANQILEIGGTSATVQAFADLPGIDELVAACASTIVDEDDRRSYTKAFGRASLIAAYSAGEVEVRRKSRCVYDDGVARISEYTARLIANPRTGHLEAVLYGRDATSEVKALDTQMSIVQALGSNYRNVFLVNTRERSVAVIKNEDGVYTEKGEGFHPYARFVVEYARGIVHPESREFVREAFSLDNVLRGLEHDDEYFGNFQVLLDGVAHHYQFRFIKNEDTGLVVLDMLDVVGMVLVDLQKPDDAVQRRADVVAHAGEKRRLGGIGSLRLGLGLARAAQRPGEDGHRGQEHHRGASDKPRLVESHELDERGFLLAVGVVGIGARDEVLFGVSDALVHDGQQHRVVLAHPHRETHRAR